MVAQSLSHVDRPDSPEKFDVELLSTFLTSFIPSPSREHGLLDAQQTFEMFDPEIFSADKTLNRLDLISSDSIYLEYIDILMSICSWAENSQNYTLLNLTLKISDRDIERFKSALKTLEGIKAILMGYALFENFKKLHKQDSSAITKAYQDFIGSPTRLHKNELVTIQLNTESLVKILSYFIKNSDSELRHTYKNLLRVALRMNSVLSADHQLELPDYPMDTEPVADDGTTGETISSEKGSGLNEIKENEITEDDEFSLAELIEEGRKSEAKEFLQRAPAVLKHFKASIKMFGDSRSFDNLSNVNAGLRDIIILLRQFNVISNEKIEELREYLKYFRGIVRDRSLASLNGVTLHIVSKPIADLQKIVDEMNVGEDPLSNYQSYLRREAVAEA